MICTISLAFKYKVVSSNGYVRPDLYFVGRVNLLSGCSGKVHEFVAESYQINSQTSSQPPVYLANIHARL